MTAPALPSYAGYRFPAEITSHAVWLYFRFSLSLHHVEVIASDTVGEFVGYAASAAKREVRVGASGRPPNQAAKRSRLTAAAVATFCRPVLAKPRYRERRRPKVRTACDIVPSMPWRSA
jgi:hypothetical protein